MDHSTPLPRCPLSPDTPTGLSPRPTHSEGPTEAVRTRKTIRPVSLVRKDSVFGEYLVPNPQCCSGV